MIVTLVRLPKSLLDWVREQATAEQIKPTALIRRWIEDRRRASSARRSGVDDSVARLAERVSRPEAVALRVIAAEQGVDEDNTSDLLAALQASVEAARTKNAPRNPDEERRGA